jgi:hypothetical protein
MMLTSRTDGETIDHISIPDDLKQDVIREVDRIGG